jgi:UDP-N-acetylmuramate dehydrogenase
MRTLTSVFGDRLRTGVPLASMTTFNIGGPADGLIDVRTVADLVSAMTAARADGVAVTMLAGGSNVLISDRGIRGLVLRLRMTSLERLSASIVRAEAGATINGVVRWTILEGLSGLEAWAGTPGTVGGAIRGNTHWAGRTIGELVQAVGLLRPDGTVTTVPGGEMAFRSDESRIAWTGEIVLWASFALTPGHEPASLRQVARRSLLYRKQTQPLRLPSAGCAFQNPVPGRDDVPAGIPWSAGALIDRAGLKGRSVGGARISTVHANFIVNEGGATARHVRALIDLCRHEVRRQFGVELREEIVCLGEF